MSYSDPEHFYIDTGYHDPLDPREDSPTQEDEDREAEARYINAENAKRADFFWKTLDDYGIIDND